MPESYQRHLPHQIPTGHPIFLTWNLKGAVPRQVLDELNELRKQVERAPEISEETPEARKNRMGKILFARQDGWLDNATNGPLHLKDPGAAQIVVESIRFGDPKRYQLHSFVVMANHVHLLITPRWELSKITQGIKGFTAHQINALQQARGRVFWQDESYDHWVRNEEEFWRIVEYIENNPVKAGLCEQGGLVRTPGGLALVICSKPLVCVRLESLTYICEGADHAQTPCIV
jgi:putative transposase